LASLDEQERLRAIYYSKRSIENAARCKATALVLHCGRVQMPDATRELIALSAHAQDRSATEVLILQQRMRDSRKERADAHLQALMRSLDELVPVAEKSGIRLGVETRYYHREIPDFEETAILLARFSGNTLGYWHDTGHAFVQEKLGFAPREGYLREFGKYCIGMHIHDVRGYDDHYAPGTGEISFTPIAPYLAKGIIPVIEAHEPATIEQLQKAREHIRALMRAQ
jgi:sugar phosphate isomerase/epimerase